MLPGISGAAALLHKRDSKAIMASLHSDHYIRNNDLFALLLRVVMLVLAGLHAPLAGDELAYDQIAANLAAGRGFVQNNNPFFPGQFLYAWQAPLYPLTLGLLYAHFSPAPLAGKVFGILIGILTVAISPLSPSA